MSRAREKKPTRRRVLMQLLHRYLREYIEADIVAAKADYGSTEYGMAHWKNQYAWGQFQGALEAARELRVIRWDGYYRFDARGTRVRRALSKRTAQLREEKYEAIRKAAAE
jgi:ribosomal protein L21E